MIMTRFLTIATRIQPDNMLQAAAIIDDALMAIHDIDSQYYDTTIRRLQSLCRPE